MDFVWYEHAGSGWKGSMSELLSHPRHTHHLGRVKGRYPRNPMHLHSIFIFQSLLRSRRSYWYVMSADVVGA